jgi:subtilisin family serine protease
LTVSAAFKPLIQNLAQSRGVALPSSQSLSESARRVLGARHAERSAAAFAAGAAERPQEKRRYIIAQPTNVPLAGPAVRAKLRDIHSSLSPSIIRSQHEDGPKVMALTGLEVELLRQRYPGLLIEQDIQHKPFFRSPLVPELSPIAVPHSSSRKLRLRVVGNQGPVVGAEILLVTSVTRASGYTGYTDRNGVLEVAIRVKDKDFEKLIVLPKYGYWSKVLEDVTIPSSGQLEVQLTPVTPNGFDWGLLLTDIRSRGRHLGRGIKVALIDSGVSRTHPSLRRVLAGGMNFVANEPVTEWWNDESGHGTHCAGVIAAAAGLAGCTWGYAPQVKLYALRVFGGVDGGGYSSDISDAIDWAVKEGCELISMSLGSDKPSAYIRQRIDEAFQAGVLCIAAAGNEAGPVAYPARFPKVVGVSAIGQKGAYPQDSIHMDAEGGLPCSKEGLYFASFSNYGEGVDLCAPGVAVTSTVPDTGFGPMDGTSMACPHVTGIAALALAMTPQLRKAKTQRASLLVDRLMGICQDVGLAREYQGWGLPMVSQLLDGSLPASFSNVAPPQQKRAKTGAPSASKRGRGAKKARPVRAGDHEGS